MSNVFDLTSHTVRLWVAVPVALAAGGWSWTPLERFSPAAEEFVYNASEMITTIRTYGRYIAGMIRPTEADAFTLTATAAKNSRLLCRDQWNWSAVGRLWAPHGEPWCVWDESKPTFWPVSRSLDADSLAPAA